VISGTWEIPGLKSESGFTGWATNGWQIGGVLQASSGAPFTVLIGGDPLGLVGTDPFAYPARLTGPGCGSGVNPGNPDNYVNLKCFGLPQATSAIAAQCVPYSTDANSCSNLLGNSGRNPLTGPGLTNVDFSLFKNTHIKRISETANLQFRAEVFNIFNHANFAPPLDNNTLFNPDGTSVGNAGVIDATQTSSRQIQFGLKLVF
jgi:hypothetical protein